MDGPHLPTQNTRPGTAAITRDPDFYGKVLLLRIIKVSHYLTNVTSEQAPHLATMSLIESNARHWEYTTKLILKDHYNDTLANDIQILLQLPVGDWQQPFTVASSWAGRHFGRRLNPKTLQDLHSMLSQKLSW